MDMPTAAQLAERRIEDGRKAHQAAHDIIEIFKAHNLSQTAAGQALAVVHATMLFSYPRDIRHLERRCFDGARANYLAFLDGDEAALAEIAKSGNALLDDAKAKLAEIVGPEAARGFGR